MQFKGSITTLFTLIVLTSAPAKIAPAADIAGAPSSWAENITSSDFDQLARHAIDLATHRNYSAAITLLESSINRYQQLGNQEWLATIFSFLGSLYQRTGRYVDAEQVLKKSIYMWTQERGPHAIDLVGPLANLGALYYEAGLFSNAEKFIVRAVDLQRTETDPEPKLAGMLLTNLGSVYFGERKDELAQQMAERALEKFDMVDSGDVESREGSARDYALLGAVSMRRQRMSDAESFLSKALEIWRAVTTANDPRRAEAIGNLGIYYSAAGDYEKSEDMFRQAGAVFQAHGGDNAYLRHFYAEYCALEQKLGHKKEAKKISSDLTKLTTNSAESVLARNVVDVSAFR